MSRFLVPLAMSALIACHAGPAAATDSINIELRLEQLRKELKTGQEQLRDLEARKHQLEQTLLRISGAIQVLEELKGTKQPTAPKQ